tara:strand:+ start:762 stop:1163 length:402 start_codon:yes stop_codon:yes gene_type:complete
MCIFSELSLALPQHKSDRRLALRALNAADESQDIEGMADAVKELVVARDALESAYESCTSKDGKGTRMGKKLAAVLAKGPNMPSEEDLTNFNGHDWAKLHRTAQGGKGRKQVVDGAKHVANWAAEVAINGITS